MGMAIFRCWFLRFPFSVSRVRVLRCVRGIHYQIAQALSLTKTLARGIGKWPRQNPSLNLSHIFFFRHIN